MNRDVRRTARTLMTRAGVPSEIAESCIAHEIVGGEGVYNRYEYVAEKFGALKNRSLPEAWNKTGICVQTDSLR
jgi:hypothetical protein